MILCQWNEQWYLSTGITPEKGCVWLRCGPNMPHPPSFARVSPGSLVLYGSVPWDERVRFYPEVKCRGMRVYPERWHFESQEPLLYCFVLGGDIRPEVLFGRRLKNASECGPLMTAAGWEWHPPDGARKFIHVDDLEKTEGPVPAGPF
jgi:hypothetical protein